MSSLFCVELLKLFQNGRNYRRIYGGVWGGGGGGDCGRGKEMFFHLFALIKHVGLLFVIVFNVDIM